MSKLRELLKAAKMNEEELAKTLGTSAGAVYHWERYQDPIPEKHIPNICEILHTTRETLFGPSKAELELIDAYRSATIPRRKLIFKLAKELSKKTKPKS